MQTVVEKYKTSTGKVLLDIIVGDAQRSATSIFLTDTKGTISELKKGDDVKNVVVGDGPILPGSVLVISSVVTDVRTETNWTSVTAILKGGAAAASWPRAEEVPQNGAASYVFVVTFE